jgi:hypothetical protein
MKEWRIKVDKEKALRVVDIANALLKLQELYKQVTGSNFTVSQNLIDTVNYAQGFIAALKTIEAPKLEEVKENADNKPS